jgi:hypothetical protein
MGIHVKVSNSGSSTDWRAIKKIWAKTGTAEDPVWSPVKALFSKVVNGWTKMWPGNPPSVDPDDPIRIRIGGFSGTDSGTFPLYAATSPQLFCSTNAGTSGTFLKLWGDDGSYDGVTPIVLSARKMKVSTNEDGLVNRTIFADDDEVDFATTSQADRDFAEGYYTFYQLLAKNADGEIDAYSQPIKVIKRRPALVSTTVLSEYGGSLTGTSNNPEVNAQIRWGWWIRPGGYLGGTPVLRWWKNTSKTPGGTLLESIDITSGYDSVSGTFSPTFQYDYNTSNVLTIYDNCGHPRAANEYIVAELYLENSYTAHYAAPVSFYGSTGNAPTITSVSLRTYDGQVDTVMDNQSNPRIVSQAYFEIVAQVADYESGTTFNFEPKFYKADTGVYLNYNTGATISNGTAISFPTDLSPYSVEVSGASATVIWRTYINSNLLPPNPTYDGGQAKYQFNFRLSATKSGGSTLYYTGLVSSNHSGTNIYPTYMNDDVGGSIDIHPHTQSVLIADNYSPGNAPQTVKFSVTGNSYPSGNASYPRSYGIDFGDGNVENLPWPTGTSNPSYLTWNHTYTTNGTFTARLITVPQGFTTIGARQVSISLGTGVASPTSLTATTNRSDGVNLTFGGSSNATGYNIFWNTVQSSNPINNVTQGDFLNKTSPFLDTTIAAGVTRWYWVQATDGTGDGYSTGVSPWYPVGNGVTGTRNQVTSYTVTWNAQGGSTGNQGSPWSFVEGGSVTAPSVSRIGYTFVRWTDTASLDYTYTTTGGTWSPPAQNITMYARWQTNVCTIPNVIGMTEVDASYAINDAGFMYEWTEYLDTNNSSLVGTVAAIDPAVGTQPGCGSNVTLTIYRTPLVLPPTAIELAPPNVTRTSGTYNYSTTNGAWNNSPTSYSYQWKAQVSLPYPPYYNTVNVGTDSSSYTSSSTYDYYSIYCIVTASNTAGSSNASSNSIQNTPTGTGPSGISVTLTPTGTQQAGTELTANVSVSSGSTPITYTIQIFKKTGGTPTNSDSPLESGTTSATHTITDTEASGTPDRFIAYATATNSYGNTNSYSNVVISTPYVAPTTPPSNSIAPSVEPTTGNAGVTTYSCTEGVWSGSTPMTFAYQWQYNDQGSLFLSISGATSSTYSPPANFLNSYISPIRCRVTATNSNNSTSAFSNTATVSAYVAPTTAPYGGGVTLTPSGTVEAGTQICANVTPMNGTSPISYLTNIRKATGSSPTGSATSVASGSGTGNAVCCHTITASEASGTPDQFKAYTVGSNSAGDFTVGSNTVISTPAATTTTTADPCLTCNSYSPSNGTYPYTGTDPYGTCASGSRYYRICVTPSGCANRDDWGSCVPVTTTTTTTTTTTAAPTTQCVCNYSDMGTYYYSPQCCNAGASYTGLPAGLSPSGGCCPNVSKPVATTTTTAAPTTTSRPLVYWKCNSSDVANPSNPCGYVGQCLYDGNTYFPAGC